MQACWNRVVLVLALKCKLEDIKGRKEYLACVFGSFFFGGNILLLRLNFRQENSAK